MSVEATHNGLRGRALAVAMLAAGALFMENLDATIIATGLPSMAHDFHVTPIALSIGITSYLLTLAVFIPISGWMAARFGERRVFSSAIAIFTIASVLCGLSHSLTTFALSRVMQGLGGAMMVPVGRLMVIRVARKDQLMLAIAYTIWPALVAPILGPPVGGWILTVARWPWMFYLNVPIGIVLFLLALRLVRDSEPEPRRRFDTVGFLLIGGASLALMTALEYLQVPGFRPQIVVVVLALFVMLLVAGVQHLRTAAEPLFDLALFRLPTFRESNLAGSLMRMSVLCVPFLLPLLFQTALGLGPLASGSLTMAVFAGNLAMKPLTNPLLRRFGFKQVLIGNGLFAIAMLAMCGFLTASTPHVVVILVLFAGGLGRSMEMTALTTMALAELPKGQTTGGATLSNTINQLSVSLGITTAALLLHGSTVLHGGPARLVDFRVAFCGMAVIALLAIPGFLRLHVDAGHLVSGAKLREAEAVSPA